MLRLIIGNKAYSSWSMRGWLAVRQSGLAFEEIVVPLYDEAWEVRKRERDLAPSNGRVPLLYDGDAAVWESLAIIDHLAERTERGLFWPADPMARALARSIAAEMHAGYQALRSEHSTNYRRHYPAAPVSDAVAIDLARIAALWGEARARFGANGPYLFGDYGAADMMFAPVVSRIDTYALPMPEAAMDYVRTILAHPDVRDWYAGAADEAWVIDKYERPADE